MKEMLRQMTMDDLLAMEVEIQKIKKEREDERFRTLTERLISLFNQIGREFPDAQISLPGEPAVYWHKISISPLSPSDFKRKK